MLIEDALVRSLHEFVGVSINSLFDEGSVDIDQTANLSEIVRFEILENSEN